MKISIDVHQTECRQEQEWQQQSQHRFMQMPQAKKHVRQTYKGMTFIPESEPHESCSDSEDDIPVATLLKPKPVCNLTFQHC